MKRAIMSGIFLLVGLDAVAMFWAWSPIQYVAYNLKGQSDCPLADSARAFYRKRRQGGVKRELANTVRTVARDASGFAQCDTPMGRFWYPERSIGVAAIDEAEQLVDIYSTEDGIRPGAIVLDCGANVGLFARKALDRGAGKVVAIEPAPENLECLRRNLAPEIAAGRVIVYPKGVWDKPDTLVLHIDRRNSAADSFIIQRDSGTADVNVPLVPIDQLVEELHLARVDFIKMDIEGAERKALAGARGTIARFKPALAICTYHLRDDPEAVPALVRQARPDYRAVCGFCYEQASRLRPEIMWFR